MTPAARLRAQAAELLRLADELDGATVSPLPTRRLEREQWIDTARAARLGGVSYSTLYRWARRFEGLGEQTATGQWRFRRDMVKAVSAVARERGDLGDVGDAPRLPTAIPLDQD